jgi:hypothetical protein
MAREDSHLATIYKNELMFDDYKFWPRDGQRLFSWERWQQYQNLFDALGSTSQHELSKDGYAILFPVSIETNLEYRVSVKGYAYSFGHLSLHPSLNSLGVDDFGRSYRRIDEHWYLYHDCGFSKPE